MPQRLRPIGVMILTLLRERDMHPYEMLQLLRERREERLIRIQQGTFYHQVSALQRDGLIEPVSVERQGNRPERTTYAITGAGDAAVLAWLSAELPRVGDAVSFRVALAEAHNLDRDHARELLGVRLDGLREAHAVLRAHLDAAAERGVQRQFLIEHERELLLMAADAEWTSALIEDLRDDEGPRRETALAWGIPSRARRNASTLRKDDA